MGIYEKLRQKSHMAEVGFNSGGGVVDVIQSAGMKLIIAGDLSFEADLERDREDMVSHLDYKYHGVKLYGILHF